MRVERLSTKCRKVCGEKHLSFPEACPPYLLIEASRETATLLSSLVPGLLGSPPVLFLSALCLFLSDFDPWSSNNCEQNESEPIPANCTGCAQILPLKVTLPEDTPKNFERLRPLVIKVSKKPGCLMNSLPIKGCIKPCKAVVTDCGLCLSVSLRQDSLCCLRRFRVSHVSTLKSQRASPRAFSPSGGAAFLRGGSHFLTHGKWEGCVACMYRRTGRCQAGRASTMWSAYSTPSSQGLKPRQPTWNAERKGTGQLRKRPAVQKLSVLGTFLML